MSAQVRTIPRAANFKKCILAENSLDQSSDNPYHAIAVTIVACFCTDQELVRIAMFLP